MGLDKLYDVWYLFPHLLHKIMKIMIRIYSKRQSLVYFLHIPDGFDLSAN